MTGMKSAGPLQPPMARAPAPKVVKNPAAPVQNPMAQAPTSASVKKFTAPAINTTPQPQVTRKPAVSIRSPMAQIPTTASVKKDVPLAKGTAAHAPVTAATTVSAFDKQPAPNISHLHPVSGTASKNRPVKALVDTRPNSFGGDKGKSTRMNPAWEPHLSLKKAGFRVPVFRPRDP